jgi:hypothetical protein
MRSRIVMALLVVGAVFACGGDKSEQVSATDARGGGAIGSQGAPGMVREEGAGASSRRDAYSEKSLGISRAPVNASPPMAPPMPPPAPEQQPGVSLPSSSQGIAPSMVIRTGDARVQVDSLEVGVQRVRQLAQRLGGYVANSQMQGGEGQERSAMLELKIPAERFDQAVEGLNGLGKKVDWVNTTAQDVGEEFVDITARVQNAKRLEDRIVVLLATRTGRLEDVLHAERELARIREEIERYEGRLRFLRTRAAISTLSITVYEKGPIVGGGGNPIVDAFRDAWRNFVGFMAWLIAAMGVLVPLGALGLLVWLLLRRFWPGWRGSPRPRDDRGHAARHADDVA